MTNHSAEDGLAFLEGGGHVGALLRQLGWSDSPLGHPRGWPQCLRSIVKLMLSTPSPMAVYWGAERTYLYNDAMAEFIGRERHPGSLGRPGAAVWSEIWDEVISPQLNHVFDGHGALRHSEKLLQMTRNGSVQDTWWNYSQTPVESPDSPTGVGGVLILGVEVTAYRAAREVATAERSRLLSMFEGSASFVAMLEGPDHRFTLANRS